MNTNMNKLVVICKILSFMGDLGDFMGDVFYVGQ